ncbi:MAG: cytochrome c3 family protein [bacterium]
MIRRPALARLLLFSLATLLAAGCGKEPEPQRLHAEAHDGLACLDCHENAPGPVGLTSIENCAACHAIQDLPEVVELAGVKFRHREHAGLLPGIHATCSACHHHQGDGTDLEVDSGACFLCHAQLPAADGRASLGEQSCLGCHGPDTNPGLEHAPGIVDHAVVIARDVTCSSCHYDAVEGSGTVRNEKCLECHGAPGLAPTLDKDLQYDAESIHRDHTWDGKEQSCRRCHEALTHRVRSLESTMGLKCASCHLPDDPRIAPPQDPYVHRAQQILYSGLAAGHDKMAPAGKFAAKVSCTACHSHDSMRPRLGHEIVAAIDVECTQCHGPKFAGLLNGWIQGMRSRTKATGDYVHRAAADPRVRASAPADSAVTEAVRLWDMVHEGNGVHNVPAADAVLRRVIEETAGAWREAGVTPPARPNLGPDPATNRCVHCHYGIENTRGNFLGRMLDHRTHVINGGLDCHLCHSDADLFQADRKTFDPRHGKTHVSLADCASCHHSPAEAGQATCQDCHDSGPKTVGPVSTFDVSSWRGDAWSHATHSALECQTCHVTPVTYAPAADVMKCTACHENHHQPGRDCARCHGRPETADAHDADTHFGCAGCHDRATISRLDADRGMCLICHAEQRTDHHEETDHECSVCHFLMTPEGMRPWLLLEEE